jgi:hypothetical protein
MVPSQLGSGAVDTTDEAVITVPAAMTYEITSMLFYQPSTGLAKVIRFGIGATTTPINVKGQQTFTAGEQSAIIYPGLVLSAGQTLNMAASADDDVATYEINGFKYANP